MGKGLPNADGANIQGGTRVPRDYDLFARPIEELESMMLRLQEIKGRVEELETQHIKEEDTHIAETPVKVWSVGFALASLFTGQIPKT